MKLDQIQEASVLRDDFVQWAIDASKPFFRDSKEPRGSVDPSRTLTKEQTSVAIKQLTRQFGEPRVVDDNVFVWKTNQVTITLELDSIGSELGVMETKYVDF